MRKKIIYVFCIISLFLFMVSVSVGYSAFGSNLSVSGDAIIRSIANIRIDSISVISTTNDGRATFNPEYTRNNTSMYSTLPNANSTIKYEVSVTNNTGNCVSVESISSLIDNNSNITYRIEGIQFNTAYCSKTVKFYVVVSTTSSGDDNKEILTLNYKFKELKEYTLTNILTNPSFENGFSPWVSWINTTNFSVTNEYSLFGDYSVKNNKSVQWDTAGQHFTSIPGHVYYGLTYMYSTLGFCYSQVGFAYNNSWHWSSANFINELSKWTRVNHYVTAPNETITDAAFITADYGGTDRNIICYADGNVLVDLTATFGSGNEPDVSWCNSNINYFEGTTKVYK